MKSVGDFQVYEKDGWVHADHVPVFDEHAEDDGQVFDEARLIRIIENCNRRIADTGDLVPLTPGHVPDDKPEEDTPVLGWASNFHLDEWGMIDTRKCIFADFKFTPENWEIAKNLPRRSIELVGYKTDEEVIDPIALLGATTPKRDLGLLCSKNLKVTARYAYELKGGRMDKDELKKLINECISEYMKAEADKKDEELKAESDEEKKGEGEKKEEELKNEDDAEKKGDEDDKEKLKNERDQERRKYARLENEHKLLASRLADLERKERVASRKADLIGIEGEGVIFDLNEELENVSDLDDTAYQKHLDVMRKRYSRSPIGVHIPVRAMAAHGREIETDLTPDQVRKAGELLLSGKAKNKDEALSMVKGA